VNAFIDGYRTAARALLRQTPIHTGAWHAQDIPPVEQYAMYELLNAKVELDIPPSQAALVGTVHPHMPWAEEHFRERVSGVPHNPPPSHKHWPWAKFNAQHQDADKKFSHTYPERFWPKFAGSHRQQLAKRGSVPSDTHLGIRFPYGDLNDVVSLLVRNPMTRQAYLPVWFPEDTGNVSNVRVPCTLGYHFMIRDGRMDCWYPMRSCDFIRHMQDDVYMAARLVQWMCQHVTQQTNEESGVDDEGGFIPGTLHMTVSSLHAFVGDTHVLNKIADGTWEL
jgi:hypothetical protein